MMKNNVTWQNQTDHTCYNIEIKPLTIYMIHMYCIIYVLSNSFDRICVMDGMFVRVWNRTCREPIEQKR